MYALTITRNTTFPEVAKSVCMYNNRVTSTPPGINGSSQR